MNAVKPFAAAAIILLLVLPLAARAYELHYRRVAHAAVMHVGEQALFTVTCGEGEQILSGGYKLVASEVPIRDLIMVESRPVPELRQWIVTLLYDPSRPTAVTVGQVKIELWAVCFGPVKPPPGPLSHKAF